MEMKEPVTNLLGVFSNEYYLIQELFCNTGFGCQGKRENTPYPSSKFKDVVILERPRAVDYLL